MARPPSMSGDVYGDELGRLEMALGAAERTAIESLTNRVIDPIEFAGYMGDVLKELRAARHAGNELREIYEWNKRVGNIE